jgi:hypothetical protein
VAARDRRYKLVQAYVLSTQPTAREFYDLQNDPGETVNLLGGPLSTPQVDALHRLEDVLAEDWPTWQTIAWGTPGTAGVPSLTGWGALQPQTPFGLSLTGARPNALVALVLGIQNISMAFQGGVFVPDPFEIHFLGTDGTGVLAGSDTWPAGIPSGASVLFQFWVYDPAGSYGFASSPGLAANVP